jgi:hypothetical protein
MHVGVLNADGSEEPSRIKEEPFKTVHVLSLENI